MKKINIFIVSICLLSLQACEHFLDLKPRNQKVVTTIEDYRDILASYVRLLKTSNPSDPVVFGGAYLYPEFDVAGTLGIYTGETSLDKAESKYYDPEKGEYTLVGKKMLCWLDTERYTWDYYYQFLGPVNLIISGIETAEGSDDDLRNYVRGEALVWRMFSYFKLLQYFAPCKNDAYGIPVYLKPYEDIGTAMPVRNTQTEVYAQLISDYQRVSELLEQTPSNDWNCAYRYDFLNAMMAGIYTYKAMSGAAGPDDWQHAAQCADEAMAGRTLANDPGVLKQMFDCSYGALFGDMTHDEFYFRIMDGYNGYICNFVRAYCKDGRTTDGAVNPLYYEMYADNDIRKEIYFNEDGTRSDKYNLYGEGPNWAGGAIIPFRLAEMYLIKAEALVRQGDAGKAKAVLEEFRRARYTGEAPSVSASPEKLLEEILLERTREFYMENDFRWLDMKRLGVSLERLVDGETFILEPDDFRYCFPIPQSEMEKNHNMVQTPGWDRVILP